MRQGHLCALAGPRHGPRPRLLRPHRRIAPDRGRAVHRQTTSSPSRSWKPPVAAGRCRAKQSVPTTTASTAIDAYLVETAAALDCLPQVAVSDDAASRIRLGNAVIVRGRDAPGRGRGSLCHGARQAGRHRRHRSRHVQAEAGFCRLVSGFEVAAIFWHSAFGTSNQNSCAWT